METIIVIMAALFFGSYASKSKGEPGWYWGCIFLSAYWTLSGLSKLILGGTPEFWGAIGSSVVVWFLYKKPDVDGKG